MANLQEEAIWQEVYEIANDDLVLGRKNSNSLGPSNIPLQQLVNRDAYLNQKIDTKPPIPLWDSTKDDYLANISFVHYTPYTGSAPHIYMCTQDTSVAGFNPADDIAHWVDLTPSAGVLMAPIGMIQAMPFRADNLPLGWIPCDGTRYSVSTWYGSRLVNLPEQYRTDHGIIIDNDTATVNTPDKVTPPIGGENKYGRFVRYGSSDYVGTKGNDAIRNITGQFRLHRTRTSDLAGAFYWGTSWGDYGNYANGGDRSLQIEFSAEKVVPVDTENVPCYEVALPCIYLGEPPNLSTIQHIFELR